MFHLWEHSTWTDKKKGRNPCYGIYSKSVMPKLMHINSFMALDVKNYQSYFAIVSAFDIV